MNSYLGKVCFVSPIKFSVTKIMFETVHLKNLCLRRPRARIVSYFLGVLHRIWNWWWHWSHSTLLLLNFCIKMCGEKDPVFWNMCFREKVMIWPSVYLGGHVEKSCLETETLGIYITLRFLKQVPAFHFTHFKLKTAKMCSFLWSSILPVSVLLFII